MARAKPVKRNLVSSGKACACVCVCAYPTEADPVVGSAHDYHNLTPMPGVRRGNPSLSRSGGGVQPPVPATTQHPVPAGTAGAGTAENSARAMPAVRPIRCGGRRRLEGVPDLRLAFGWPVAPSSGDHPCQRAYQQRAPRPGGPVRRGSGPAGPSMTLPAFTPAPAAGCLSGGPAVSSAWPSRISTAPAPGGWRTGNGPVPTHSSTGRTARPRGAHGRCVAGQWRRSVGRKGTGSCPAGRGNCNTRNIRRLFALTSIFPCQPFLALPTLPTKKRVDDPESDDSRGEGAHAPDSLYC